MLRGRSRSAIRGWSPVPASNVPALSLCLSEKQRVDTDEGFTLAKTLIVDVGAASLECKGPSHERHHLAPLRHFSLCGESSDRAGPQGPCLGIGRASRHHAETESDGADGRLSQDAGFADWRGHLLRQPVDHARTRAPVPHSELLSRRPRHSRRACLVGREDNLLDQLRAHFNWLDQTLADGRSFLQGPAAGLADLAAYHPVWFLRQNFGSAAAPLDGFPRLLTWAERIAAIGHGRRSQMSAQ